MACREHAKATQNILPPNDTSSIVYLISVMIVLCLPESREEESRQILTREKGQNFNSIEANRA